MNLFRKREIKTLSEWLEIATRKLAAPAKERIKTEIESHYAESVQTHIEDGLSDLDAQAAALAELGDAVVSARRFRKRHLTKWESSIIKIENKASRNKFFLFVAYFTFSAIAVSQLQMSKRSATRWQHTFLFLTIEFVLLIALPTICFVLAPYPGKNLRSRSIFLMMAASGSTEGIIVNTLFLPHPDETTLLLTIPICLFLFAKFLYSLRLWWKLGVIGATHRHSHFPPLDTPAPE